MISDDTSHNEHQFEGATDQTPNEDDHVDYSMNKTDVNTENG